jgi:ribonuclease HI
VLSGLDGATSRVRTKHGLTRKFDLSTGVRQGDPLSPLIYIITLDALHAGLRGNNPIFPTQSLAWGYRFRAPDPDTGDVVRVASVGYADDTVMIATSLESVTRMHAWVREFFGAHRAALNCSKSHLLCSDGAPTPALPSVDGRSLIKPKGETDTIRYLGAWINLRLDWSVHIARMDRFVWSVASSIRRNGFDLVMSKTAVNQFLLPGIRLGLLITDVPGKAVEAWDTRIRQAALAAAGVTLRRTVNVEAFYGALLFPRLADQRWALRGEEHMVSVIAQYPSSCSYRARMAALRAGPKSCRAVSTQRNLGRKVGARFVSRAPAAPVLVDPCPRLWEPTDPVWHSWTPYDPPVVRHRCAAAQEAATVHIYTDGSTGPTRGEPSGCAVVTVIGDVVVRVHGFPCRASGNNYLAEMAALLAALQAVPSDVEVIVHTDCLSGIFSANKRRCRDWARDLFLRNYALPQRRRILCAARPILNGIRAVVGARSALTRLDHVRSHSGALDVHSRMNQVADGEANRARCAALGKPSLPLDIYGEERHIMYLGRIPVIGAFKPAILRSLSARAVIRWSRPRLGSSVVGTDLPPLAPTAAHSARLISAHRDAVLAFSHSVSRSRDPWLIRFWLLAVTEWLPVERRLVKSCRPGASFRGHGCKLCGAEVETVRHVFACPHRELVARRANSIGSALRVLAVAGIRSRQGAVSCPFPPRRAVLDGRECEVRWVPAWFDLSGYSWLEVCVPDGPSNSGETELDPLAAVLGVMPSEMTDLLFGKRLPSGSWCRRTLREVSDLQEGLQVALLRGALELWKERCRALSCWWSSPAAESARRVRSELLEEIMRKRGSSKERRAGYAYSYRMKKKRLKRLRGLSSPELPPRRSKRVRRLTDLGPDRVRQGVMRQRSSGRRQLDLPWF